MRAAAAVLVVAALGGCQGERHFRVPSSAMEPTLHCARPAFGCLGAQEDKLVVRAYGSARPRRGDVVVFETPALARERCGVGGKFIKRVVGLPGERWSERHGVIEIDGRPLREPYVRPERRDSLSFSGGRIAPSHYLLLGDNRASSCDSREWGIVQARSIVGKVVEVDRGPRRIRFP